MLRGPLDGASGWAPRMARGKAQGTIPRPQQMYGEVSEWLKEHAWKVCKRVKPFRGFESRPLRQFQSQMRAQRTAGFMAAPSVLPRR